MNKLIKNGLKKGSNTLKRMFKKKNYPKVLLLLAVLIILYFIRQKFLVNEGFESKTESFGNDVKTGKKLVLFYADWCGHCKSFKPIWDEAANETNVNGENKMIKVNLGGKDPKNEEIMEKYHVDGFPTVALLNDGKLEQTYQGDRDKSSIINFITKSM